MDKPNVVGVVSKNSLDYVEQIFDCYLKGETVVLLRSSDDVKRIDMMGVSKVIEPVEKTGWFEKNTQFRDDDQLAQVSFTSGTEGEPKGVLLTHRALADVTQRLNDIMKVDDSIREYIGIPANFSFGFGRFRAVIAAGGKAYLPNNGFDPVEIQTMLVDEQINAISAVPSLWRVLLKNKSLFGDETQRLKWIEIGSQYMSQAEKSELKELFPNAIIVQHYGLTEASRTSFLRIDTAAVENLESVGRAYGETELKISDSGKICIRGPHVSKTLMKNGEYISNVDDEGWFETSDLGKVENGFLYYLGRADDQINCNGIKVNPDSVEREVRESLGIKDGIAVGAIDDPLYGQAVLIAIKKELASELTSIIKSARQVVAKRGINGAAVKFIQVDSFPVTSTNKVRRKALADMVNERTLVKTDTAVYSQPRDDFELSLSVVWQNILKKERIGIDDNFFEVGGDSLSAVIAVHEMDKASGAGIALGDLFTYPTIRDLSNHIKSGGEKALSSVVPLKHGSANDALFCLCGINLYQDLANSLPETMSAYGIYVAQEEAFFRQVLERKGADISTKVLSDAYAEAILRFQQKGPYKVLGASFGGMIALETAIKLKQLGHDVDLVVMLDSILPSSVNMSLIKRLRQQLKTGFHTLSNFFSGKESKQNIDILRKQAYHKALVHYQSLSDSYDGKVILIKATDRIEWGSGVSFEDDYGWTKLLGFCPEIHELNGSHLEILTPPLAQMVAKIITTSK